MKIGVSTLALFPMSLKEMLDYLNGMNVKYIELIKEYPYDSIDYELINSYEFKTSVHAPLSDINLASANQSIRKASIDEIKNSMDLAVKIDAHIVVVHPGHMAFLARQFKENIVANSSDSLKECSLYAEELGLKMCVENMPDMEGMLCKDLEELHNLTKEIDSYMTLDVGHAHNMGISVEDMVKYDNLEHIHLSDNDGSFDNHDAVGSESINFEILFKKLKDIKFPGISVIEVKQPYEILKSLDYIKNLKI